MCLCPFDLDEFIAKTWQGLVNDLMIIGDGDALAALVYIANGLTLGDGGSGRRGE